MKKPKIPIEVEQFLQYYTLKFTKLSMKLNLKNLIILLYFKFFSKIILLIPLNLIQIDELMTLVSYSQKSPILSNTSNSSQHSISIVQTSRWFLSKYWIDLNSVILFISTYMPILYAVCCFFTLLFPTTATEN